MTKCKSEQDVSNETPPTIKKLGSETCRLARHLDEMKYIYALYGLLDGLSLSYSMIKYLFDVLSLDSDNSASDKMHHWLVSPEGAAIAAFESITLIVFSLLGNLYSEKSKSTFERYIAVAWPYCRDSMKGLKNGYKGVRSSILALASITGESLHDMIVPVGVALGALSMANRFCMRKFVKEPRLAKTRKNAELLLEIKGTAFHLLEKIPEQKDMASYQHSFILVNQHNSQDKPMLYYVLGDSSLKNIEIRDPEQLIKNIQLFNAQNTNRVFLSDKQRLDLITANSTEQYISPIAGLDEAGCDAFRRRTESQSSQLNAIALFGAAYGGLVDGLYLYMGSLGLVALAPSALMWMASSSFVFAVLCIVSRIYEERDFQRRFLATQAKIELAICGRELEAALAMLQRLSNPLCQNLQQIDEELKRLYDQRAINNLTEQEFNQSKQVRLKFLQKTYTDGLIKKQTEFEQKREKLRDLVKLSGSLAFFAGIRDGLASFSAITSLMFAAGIVCTLGAYTLPAVILPACMAVGIACLIFHVVYSLYRYSIDQRNEMTREVKHPDGTLFDFLAEIKEKIREMQDLQSTEVRAAITGRMVVDPSPQFFIQEGWEVVRSFGSGVYKGQKLVEFVQSMWDGLGLSSGEENTTLLWDITIGCTVIQALIFSLRALARGFGRDAPDVVPSVIINKLPTTSPKLPQPSSLSQAGFFTPSSSPVVTSTGMNFAFP